MPLKIEFMDLTNHFGRSVYYSREDSNVPFVLLIMIKNVYNFLFYSLI